MTPRKKPVQTSAERFREEFRLTAVLGATPLLAVVTPEEPRAMGEMKLAVEQRAIERRSFGRQPKFESIYRWSNNRGLVKLNAGPNGEPKAIEKTYDILKAIDYVDEDVEEGLVVFADASEDLKSSKVARAFKELAWSIVGRDIFNPKKGKNVRVVLLAPQLPQNESLAKEIRVISLGLPDETEMRALVNQKCVEYAEEGVPVTDSETERQRLAVALLGCTFSEAENIVALAIVKNRGLNEDTVQTAMDEKARIIRQIEGVDYVEPEDKDGIGGYEGLKAYLRSVAKSFDARALAFGKAKRKGILLVGPPGVGKDYAARVASAWLGLPLMLVDLGKVMAAGGALLGQAEAVWNRIIAITRVVKLIFCMSEFEKAFGSGDGERDGGTKERITATALSWMADQEDCFIIASANSLRGLRPEQYREGRFDSNPMFVNVPNVLEREEILEVHIKKVGRPLVDAEGNRIFDLAEVARRTEWFSGAELKGVVRRAIDIAWDTREGNPDLRTEDLLEALKTTRPLAESNAEIQDIIAQATREKWLFANTPLPEPSRDGQVSKLDLD